MKSNVLERFHNIIENLSTSSLEEVSGLLDYFNGDVVVINGVSYHPYNDPITAFRLNARYHELTGEDHPRFISQVPVVIENLMKDRDKLISSGAYTPMYFDRLDQIRGYINGENRGLEISEQHHPIEDLDKVLNNLSNASLEEVSGLLDYFNGDVVVINGVSYHPYNDPITAFRLNARYHELTGEDHPRFISQVPVVIESLMKDKNKLISSGAYTPMYFDRLDQINQMINNSINENTFGGIKK